MLLVTKTLIENIDRMRWRLLPTPEGLVCFQGEAGGIRVTVGCYNKEVIAVVNYANNLIRLTREESEAVWHRANEHPQNHPAGNL